MVFVPERLTAACRGSASRMTWLRLLPDVIRRLQERWALSLDAPFNGCSCSWVAPATRRDGSRAVLKLGIPHMEGAHELQGLRIWDGDPTVRLLDADDEWNAMLLEACEPGVTLGQLPEPDQDVVIARLLRRLWQKPARAVSAARGHDRVLDSREPGGRGKMARRRAHTARPPPVRRAFTAVARRRPARHGSSCGQRAPGAARALARDRSEAVRWRPHLRRDPAPAQLSESPARRSTRHDSARGRSAGTR